MTSYQASAGGSKAAKFHAANPLGPMADPFAGLHDDDQQDYQKAVAENIQKRMEQACDELKEKHERGTNQVDDPDRAPTGQPYRQLQQQALQRDQQKRVQESLQQQQELSLLKDMKENMQRHEHNHDDEDEDDVDDYSWLEDDEDDPAMEAIRQARRKELRNEQIQHAQHRALGHGQVRTIAQDEFLPECTGSSKYVVVHFVQDEFERCKIMDFHLDRIAPLHMECKFLRLNAKKAPFFVTKLKIQTLPTLLVFCNGKTIARLVGFDGLASHDPNKPDEWPTTKLQEWLSDTGAIDYEIPQEELQQEMDRVGLTPKGAIWRGGSSHYDEDDD